MAEQMVRVRYIRGKVGFLASYKPAIAKLLIDRGEVERVEDAKPEPEATPETVSTKTPLPELRRMAAELGIEGAAKMSKRALLDAFEEIEREPDDEADGELDLEDDGK